MRLPHLFAIVCALCPGLSSAHEFWVEPKSWQVMPGEPLLADLRNGEMFEGASLAWFEKSVARAELAQGDRQLRFSARMGNRPALEMTAPGEGLAVLLHETTPARITYKTWEKFQRFVDHKALPISRAAHLADGHPATGFTETYTRHAKALVSVGSGDGADRAYGLATEFVAETNPYAETFKNEMRVRVLYDGAPRGHAQVEIFEKGPDDAVEVRLTQTDAEGRAVIAVKPGHAYLLDAVVLRPGTQAGAIYDTLWAALSFYVPE